MAKKDNLPLAVDTDTEPGSNIVYANEVIATIAGIAAAEVEGIASMCNITGGSLLGKKSGTTKGVKVDVSSEEACVDLYLTVEYGTPIQKAAHDAQENVRRAIESMTGLRVSRVDVHVLGVSFEKENSVLTAGQKSAVLEAAEPAAPAETVETAEVVDEEPAVETEIVEDAQEEPEFVEEPEVEIVEDFEEEIEAAAEFETEEETGIEDETEEKAAETAPEA